MGEKRAGQLQYLAGPPQFLDLALWVRDPLGLIGRDALMRASIDIGTFDSFVQSLRQAANLGRDGLDDRP